VKPVAGGSVCDLMPMAFWSASQIHIPVGAEPGGRPSSNQTTSAGKDAGGAAVPKVQGVTTRLAVWFTPYRLAVMVTGVSPAT